MFVKLLLVLTIAECSFAEFQWNMIYQNQTVGLFSLPKGTYTAVKDDNNWVFLEENDVKSRWIGNLSSTWITKFKTTDEMIQSGRVLLVLHGVDTFSKVKLNEKIIGETSNMFVRYVFDVKDSLKLDKSDENLLSIDIESSITKSKELFDEQSKDYIVYPTCVPSKYNGECHVNHIRKMQASFGWDWGPAIPSSGIWKSVEVIAVNPVHIVDHTVDVFLSKDQLWKVNVTLSVELASEEPVKGFVNAKLQTEVDSIFNSEEILLDNGEKQATISIELDIPQEKIQLWWPNGYGFQHLYNLTVELKIGNNISDHQIRKQIGFRTVELVQEPMADGSDGLTFYFKVNKVEIFAKGSNSIPVKLIPEQSFNRSYIDWLLKSAKDVHMNMLRVWGGGVYESEDFYSLADKYGIMIWQDFMFACSMYPTNAVFLDSVRTEVVQNVWRLKSHPSVAIWAGNNENEAALFGDWYGTGAEKIYQDDYIKLYVNLIKNLVEKLDPHRPFVVSSPSNGIYAEENGWLGTDPYSPFYGDTHYYNYFVDGWDINTYPRPRFASEYGFQSLPSFYNIKNVVENPGNLTMESQFLDHRQHLPLGNSYMKFLIKQNFIIPQTSDKHEDLKSFIYLSQIYQAQAVKVQTEFYRQGKGIVDNIGRGNTTGALYWQLNDVWTAPSWSSIDSEGRWKVLHNYAKDFFAPVIISPHLSGDQLSIFIVSDELQPRMDCLVEINVHKIWEKVQPPVFTKEIRNVTVKPNTAQVLVKLSLNDLLKDAVCESTDAKKKNCIVELVLKDSEGKKIADNFVYSTSPKDLKISACELTVSFGSEQTDGSIPVSVYSPGGTQLFVYLDLDGYIFGKFSENGFHVLQSKKTIRFYPSQGNFDYSSIQKLMIKSLGQIYSNTSISNNVCVNCISF